MMVVVMQGIIIPTHAPHAGSDLRSQALMVHLGNFNPRPPHARGDGKTFDEMTIDELKFQSPPPMREATRVGESRCEVLVISIPASHARSDGVRARCGTG